MNTIYFVFTVMGVAFGAFIIVNIFRNQFTVSEGFAGVLTHEGRFVERLAPGRHVRWGLNFALVLVDVRKSHLLIAAQEVLTSDSVSLKLSVIVSHQVSDPVKATHETQNWSHDLYHATQLALRAVVNAEPVESLLAQRLDIGARLLARVQPEAAKAGVTVHSVEVKDVMFPAELKRAFSEVLKAKQEGQAALERARGESAALRNLANAARVLEGNPALHNLRLMQSLTAAHGAGSTFVVGVPGGFVPVKNTKPATEPAPETGES